MSDFLTLLLNPIVRIVTDASLGKRVGRKTMLSFEIQAADQRGATERCDAESQWRVAIAGSITGATAGAIKGRVSIYYLLHRHSALLARISARLVLL